MEFIKGVIDFILHLDAHLSELIQSYGAWTYGILFAIIFCETGLVVTPFLPGDSLLFAAGAFAARGDLNVVLVFVLLIGGRGPRRYGQLLDRQDHRSQGLQQGKEPHLQEGLPGPDPRFLREVRRRRPSSSPASSRSSAPSPRSWPGSDGCPIVKFISYNVIGGIGWVALFTFGGYFFGNIPFVRKNFSLVIIAIIIISLIPAVVEVLRHRKKG